MSSAPAPPAFAETANVAELLSALIQIPSVNPDGDPGATLGDGSIYGEKACAEYVGAALAELGAEVCYEEVLPGRPNVIGRFPSTGRSGGPRLLFAPHTDTVGVSHMTIPPFDGAIRGGRVHGRGASDTKGTMAAMLWAFRELGDRLGSLDCEVAFVGLMGEETGQPGSRHFAGEHGDEFDFALVGEPTSLDIVHTHKGCFWTKVITRGVACHGATPEKGENAIVKMSRLVEALDGDFRKALAAFDDPVLGHATINIGIIRGGTRANIVPDRCELELDLRLTPSISLDEAREKLTAFLLELDPDMELRPMLECTPLATDPEHALAQRLLSVEKPGGGEVALTGAPWFCDAAVLADGGIPAVAIGPGSIAEAHTVDEGLAVADLEAGAEFYRRFLESFGA